LIIPDSLADYFRKKYGKRPSVDTHDPAILINLHVSNNLVTISLDSSVIPLFKRGYRQEQTTAPLNEVLAAGILMLSGWNAFSSLTDPMCGSGTISIEAGLLACRIPPGRFREFFGFMKWKDFDKKLFEDVKDIAASKIRQSPVKISASDISADAVLQARENISGAGLNDVISIKVCDFKEVTAYDENGHIFLNPPYGQRLQPDDTDTLYSMIGSTLKHNFPGNTAWLITSNKDSLKKVGLKPKEKHTLYNGALECILLKYELYQGSKKPIS